MLKGVKKQNPKKISNGKRLHVIQDKHVGDDQVDFRRVKWRVNKANIPPFEAVVSGWWLLGEVGPAETDVGGGTTDRRRLVRKKLLYALYDLASGFVLFDEELVELFEVVRRLTSLLWWLLADVVVSVDVASFLVADENCAAQLESNGLKTS